VIEFLKAIVIGLLEFFWKKAEAPDTGQIVEADESDKERSERLNEGKDDFEGI